MADTSKYTISLSAPATLTATLGAGKINVNDYTLAVEEVENGVKLTLMRGSKTETLFIPNGAKGDKGDKGDPGSDANVTAENIQSALGYVPVKDVQVAGNSVLDGSVANVPIGGGEKYGVFRCSSIYGYGLDTINEGVLCTQPATDYDIDNRVNYYPIVPLQLDYAVKAAMCDGKGAAWTSAEQKAARKRVGVDKAYELIEEITLTEETQYIVRNVSLRTVYVEIETPNDATEDSSYEYVVLDIGSIRLSMYCGKIAVAGNKRYVKLLAEQKGGKYMVTVYGSSDSFTNPMSAYFQHNAIGVDGDKISKIHFTNARLPIGTIIKIYGVSV